MTQKEKIKHERVLKLKKIGFWTLNIVSYILAGLFLIVLIISLSTPKKQNVSPRGVNNLYNVQITEVIREDTPNNIVYDDSDHIFIFNSNELITYKFNNLNNYLKQSSNNAILDDTYLTIHYSNDDTITLSIDDQYIYNDYFVFSYSNDGKTIYFNVGVDDSTINENNINKFVFDELLLLDIDRIDWNFEDNTFVYDDIKSVVELDIQANQPTPTIFQSITQVLTNFITTLNSGITSVLNLFWNSTTSQLTLLGNLTTIVIGVAVCFFLFRLVIGLIRLRG